MAVPLPVTLEFAGLLVLFAAAAFFSMSETAMIGVNRWEVRRRAEQGDHAALLVDKMLDDPERILSTVLVGSTIVNISAAAVGTYIAEQVFTAFPTLIATVFVTVVVLVMAELVPKTLAVQNPIKFALALGRPLQVAEKVLRPFIALSGAASRLIVRMLGVQASGKAPFLTTDEIEMLVRVGVEQGNVERFEQRVISDLFEFTETAVATIMTPAAKVRSIPRNSTMQQALRVAAKEGRSRILIVEEDFDHVLGFVHIKDLLHYTDEQLEALPATIAIRTCLYTTAATNADRLLVRMQKEHRSLAVVQDAEGRNVGIITADDLVEELVGEIHDEFDAARKRAEPGLPKA